MPHGYRCDRCDTFEEQDRMGVNHDAEIEWGPVETVTVNPESGDDDSVLHKYTLCPRCRQELVAWVEGYGNG